MNAVVTIPDRPSLAVGGRPQAIVPQTMDEAYRLGKAICMAGMAPRGMDTPEKCMIAIMRGMEVGLTPMQALDKIAVVNGRPTIWGDGAMALVRGSGVCEGVLEWVEGDGDHRTAFCEANRRGEKNSTVRTFSVADAKKAGLWGKSGPWQQFPDRMLQMRARAFALRDLFADVLGGLYLKEEVDDRDTATSNVPAAAIEHHVPPAAPPPPAYPQAVPPSDGDEYVDDGEIETREGIIQEVDDRLGFAMSAEEVEEAYVDADAEARLSAFETGVEAARELKAKHLDRIDALPKKPAAPPVEAPAADPADDFPGNDALREATPPPPDPEGYKKRLLALLNGTDTTREQLRRFWMDTAEERDGLGLSDAIRDKWRAAYLSRLKELEVAA